MSEVTLKAIEQILDVKLAATELRIIKRIDDAQEELARITNTGFEDVLERLDVRERIFKLESDVHAIKEALHLSV
jgi:hypothetical protein